MTSEQRERNKRLVPRTRNQDRKIGFVLIQRKGEVPKVKAVRAGHAHHVASALIFADVSVVKRENGTPLVVKASDLSKKAVRKIVRRPA